MRRGVTLLIVAGIAIVVVASLTLLLDTSETNKYATAADAVRAGALTNGGWLPTALAPDATEIKEWHDIEAEKVRGTFLFTAGTLERLDSRCTPIRGDENVSSAFSDWPSFLPPPDTERHWQPRTETAERLAARSIKAYYCEDFTVAVDIPEKIGYFWH